MNSSVCVFSISACLQDKLLCFSDYLRWYIYSSLIACIKMSVSLTNPKQQAPFFRHTKILHMLVSERQIINELLRDKVIANWNSM